jgi:probable HAF family extracellular repeat protein
MKSPMSAEESRHFMRSHRKTLYLLLSAFFITATATAAFAQTGSCSFQTLSFPPPATNGGAVALNDSGAILGGFTDSQSHIHGFLLFQGNLATFMFPGSINTMASGMSATGTIVGEYTVAADQNTHLFMVQSGSFHEIKLPGFPNPFTAKAVNSSGDVVGQVPSSAAAFGIGYLLHNGKLTQLSFPGAAGATVPTGINDQGVIVGNYLLSSEDRSHGFMWINGVFSNVNPPDGDGFVSVAGISNAGAIVGTYLSTADDQTHGFAFKNGTYTKIDVPGFQSPGLISVNKFDNVIADAQKTVGGPATQFKGFCAAAF